MGLVRCCLGLVSSCVVVCLITSCGCLVYAVLCLLLGVLGLVSFVLVLDAIGFWWCRCCALLGLAEFWCFCLWFWVSALWNGYV